MKEKSWQPRILYPPIISFRNNIKMDTVLDEGKLRESDARMLTSKDG
jgi:hypothetical protein